MGAYRGVENWRQAVGGYRQAGGRPTLTSDDCEAWLQVDPLLRHQRKVLDQQLAQIGGACRRPGGEGRGAARRHLRRCGGHGAPAVTPSLHVVIILPLYCSVQQAQAATRHCRRQWNSSKALRPYCQAEGVHAGARCPSALAVERPKCRC